MLAGYVDPDAGYPYDDPDATIVANNFLLYFLKSFCFNIQKQDYDS